MAVIAGRAVSEARGFAPYLPRLDLGSLHALQASQVQVRFILYRQIRSGFARWLDVSWSGGSTMPASGRAYYRLEQRWSVGRRHMAQSVTEPFRFSEL